MQAPACEVFTKLQDKLKAFLVHVYVKRKQSEHMKNMKNSVDGIKVFLQVDFSEKASLVSQNEIQSAHWYYEQVTIFTAHAWRKDDTTESFVIVSDELQHNKLSLYAFMCHIFSELRNKYSSIKEINVFQFVYPVHGK